MKEIKLLIIVFLLISIGACSIDDNVDTKGIVTFEFTHHWDGTGLSQSDFNELKFTNENEDKLSIEKLRYLISDITFHKSNGEKIVIEDYQLVDLSKPESLSYQSIIEIPFDNYSNVSITFGFDEEDNIDGEYLDLNAASWNVPTMLGGGYHYMQFEGKFIDDTSTNTGFQYHAIRAADISGTTPVFKETFIEKDLGAVNLNKNTTLEIKMNIAEWFKNPNTWDLNELHSMMMPNYDAQIMIYENGKNVFSLGEISQ